MSLQRPRLPLSLLTLGLALSTPSAFAQSNVTLAPVTVSDTQNDGYQSRQAQVAGFAPAPLLDTPASVSVFTEQLLQDRQVRLLSEVLQSDASVGDSYAPVGYYENFSVRGFSLDAAHSYKINGQTITGEQNVALENKQQVELLKGLSGLQSGVSEPGGVINYVTKRPQDVRSVTVSSNEQGERYIATDLGGWFGSERQFGLRTNLAHEDIRSYIDHADGQRDFASLAFDWQMSPDALLQLDVEYQNRKQRSVPGYQLLGNDSLPHGIDPDDRLAYQPWANPVKMDSLNLGGRFEYRFNDAWTGSVSASRSRVVIDDYSSFAWGCFYVDSCDANYFSPQGDYDIYDFRSPDDTRRTDEAQTTLTGRFAALGVDHELTVGGSAQRRTLDQRPTFNERVGTGNIYQETPAFGAAPGVPGHSERRLDSRQYGLFINDRISFNENWQTVLGARAVRLDEKTFDDKGGLNRHTQQYELLPNAALIYKPWQDTSLYTSYSKGLSSGGSAPWFAANYPEILAPTTSHQIELGIKRDWQRMSFTAALFQLRQAYQYTRPSDSMYVQQGQQKNIGLELAASGWVTSDLQLNASAAAIRARVKGSGTDAYDDHQALNVPRLRAALQADYSVPGVAGLALLGGVRYSASKYANYAGTVEAGGYTVFDIGSRYRTRIAGYDTVLRLTVDNLFDRRYWRDAGEYLGDGYLFQGAPRTARVSASVNF